MYNPWNDVFIQPIEDKHIKRCLLLTSGIYWLIIVLFVWMIISNWVFLYHLSEQWKISLADESIKICSIICWYILFWYYLSFAYTSDMLGLNFIKRLAVERSEHLPEQTFKFVKLMLFWSLFLFIVSALFFYYLFMR